MNFPSLNTLLRILASVGIICLLILAAIAVRVYLISARVDNFLTVDRLRNIENNLDTTAATSQQMVNEYAKIANTATDSINRHLNPTIDRVGTSIESATLHLNRRVDDLQPLFSELTATTRTANNQVAKLGNAATQSINTLNDDLLKLGQGIEVVTTDALPQIVAFATSLKQTGEKLQIYVDDPTIADDLRKMNAILGNVEVISGELAGTSAEVRRESKIITDWTDKSLNPPKSKGFSGFVKRFVLTPLRTSGGVIYLWVKVANGL